MKYDYDYFVSAARVGKQAPRFEMPVVLPHAESSQRISTIRLDQLLNEGFWVVLYFYPMDFTFVCPTEIKRFNELNDAFETKKAKLIAISTDSVYSHLNWQASSLGNLNHYHASDQTHKVSEAYGVLEESLGVAWRGTFIIAPSGILKSISIQHGEAGRNVDDVLRTLEVFQNEVIGKMVPCNWQPGQPFIDNNKNNKK